MSVQFLSVDYCCWHVKYDCDKGTWAVSSDWDVWGIAVTEVCISQANKLAGLCNIPQEVGKLCELYLMHGINLPVVVNPHLTNPSLRDLNHWQCEAMTGTLLVERNEEQWRGTVIRGNTYSSLYSNRQGLFEKKVATEFSLVSIRILKW